MPRVRHEVREGVRIHFAGCLLVLVHVVKGGPQCAPHGFCGMGTANLDGWIVRIQPSEFAVLIREFVQGFEIAKIVVTLAELIMGMLSRIAIANIQLVTSRLLCR